MTVTKFTVIYRPFWAQRDLTQVIVTAKPYAQMDGEPTFYATAPGAGCSKNYRTPREAALALVEADLGHVHSIKQESHDQ